MPRILSSSFSFSSFFPYFVLRSIVDIHCSEQFHRNASGFVWFQLSRDNRLVGLFQLLQLFGFALIPTSMSIFFVCFCNVTNWAVNQNMHDIGDVSGKMLPLIHSRVHGIAWTSFESVHLINKNGNGIDLRMNEIINIWIICVTIANCSNCYWPFESASLLRME